MFIHYLAANLVIIIIAYIFFYFQVSSDILQLPLETEKKSKFRFL